MGFHRICSFSRMAGPLMLRQALHVHALLPVMRFSIMLCAYFWANAAERVWIMNAAHGVFR